MHRCERESPVKGNYHSLVLLVGFLSVLLQWPMPLMKSEAI